MHLSVHRWLHGVWLAAVLVLERVCVALPLLVKGIVRFRQAQVRLLLGQLYIKENPARVALNSPLLSCKIMTFKRVQTQFGVQGVISLQSMYERTTARLRACMRALCDLIIVKIFLGFHPDISM